MSYMSWRLIQRCLHTAWKIEDTSCSAELFWETEKTSSNFKDGFLYEYKALVSIASSGEVEGCQGANECAV